MAEKFLLMNEKRSSKTLGKCNNHHDGIANLWQEEEEKKVKQC